MKGTIRFFTGFILTVLVASSIESAMTIKELLILTFVALIALTITFSGVNAINKELFKDW